MRVLLSFTCVLVVTCICANIANAHFGIVIPSQSMVMDNKKAVPLEIDIAFSHPFSGQGMPMQMPAETFVMARKSDNKPYRTQLNLSPSEYMGEAAFKASLVIDKPGVYQIGVIPKPYHEPAENCYIIHYVKTVIGAFGDEEYWDEPLGLPVEIVPLSRPFGNYRSGIS